MAVPRMGDQASKYRLYFLIAIDAEHRRDLLPVSTKSHDHVHRLVRSMSGQEKRYFKLFIGRNSIQGHSNHLVLFNAIAEQTEYDEAALLARFQHEAFTHRFAVTKRRLYEAILRSLDAFHAEHSVDAKLARLLHQVRILYDKALYGDASKLMISATRMARQHDRHHALLACQEWERRLAEQDGYAQVGPAELERIGNNASALLQDLAELDGLWDLKSRLFLLLYRQGQVRTEQMREAVDRMLAEPLLHDPAQNRTARARYLPSPWATSRSPAGTSASIARCWTRNESASSMNPIWCSPCLATWPMSARRWVVWRRPSPT
jgi:hypothetical protein